MKVKKNLSIEDTLLTRAEKKAKSLGISFSAYIAILLNRDLSGEVVIDEEPKKEIKLSDDVRAAYLGILGED